VRPMRGQVVSPVCSFGRAPGHKFRIHPLAAAIALDQLAHLDEYLQGRAAVAARMCGRLGSLPVLIAPALPAGTTASWYGLPLTYQPEELGGLPVGRFHRALLASCPAARSTRQRPSASRSPER
jgi:dTDP-4-amino-4,6-dideoxygalactose transaminase